MRKLDVYVEIMGKQHLVGEIVGESYLDACFRYNEYYMNSDGARPISISLPFQNEYFDAPRTKNFFEGLLPEGFSRKAVANWMKADEQDYITILSELGKECLGAIRIAESETEDSPHYEKLTLNKVRALAQEGATSSTQILIETHLSLTGATGKVGLYYNSDNDEWYLPKGSAPSTHIVKQSHVRLRNIVVNEHLCILTAKHLGIKVPDSFIINTGDGNDESILFASSRYDRKFGQNNLVDGLPCPLRLHQEDFAQALGIVASEKYEKRPNGYMSKMFNLIRNCSANPIFDQSELLKIICFNYLIGNTDCHIKNFSLLYDEKLSGIRLAPAYDLVSTRVYKMTEDMSFYIGGELNINNISRKTFALSSSEIGMGEKMVMKIFDDLADKFESAIEAAANELEELGFAKASEIKTQIIKLGGYGKL